MLCNFTILKSQHNYSLSQPAMEWLDLHLLLSCQYHYPTIMSFSSPFSGLSIISSKQVGNHLKWWWLNTGGVLKIAWLHTKLQNPSRFLCLFLKTVTADHCPGEQFPGTGCESMPDSAYAKNVRELGTEPQYINHMNRHFYPSWYILVISKKMCSKSFSLWTWKWFLRNSPAELPDPFKTNPNISKSK